MCGLFGYFLIDADKKDASLQLQLLNAKKLLIHRGPDDSGISTFKIKKFKHHSQASLSLGHCRLSILDLSKSGHQPMNSHDGRFTIVYNGEIYNYREIRSELEIKGYKFKTETDTEVLLQAWRQWGENCLKKLSGMFAFAVYDKTDCSLHLARDAFGIKPLFYHYDSYGFKFASELQALVALLEKKPALNLQRSYYYLAFGKYDDAADTFYKEINHLPPGHLIHIDLRTAKVGTPKRWWWPSIQERNDLSFDQAAEKLREMFLDNVRLHLRSDVPLGAALSGGLDSSAVVCAMRHLEPDIPIHTFSYIATGTNINEEKWIDLVNNRVNAIPHKIFVEPSDLAADLDDMIQAQGEPFSSTSIYAQYRVFKAAREAGIVVTLDGQGADELLAGYEGYPENRFRSLLDKKQYLELIKFLKEWSKWPNRGLVRAMLKLGAALTPLSLRSSARKIMGQNPVPSWLDVRYLEQEGINLDFPERLETLEGSSKRRLVSRLREAISGDGLAMLLRHGDRNSMRWSIESRVPFLTTDIAEFLLQLPENFLLSPQGETKHIFRAAMRGLVPDAILDRKDKIGFETPEKTWLKETSSNLKDLHEARNGFGFLKKETYKFEKERLSDLKGYSKFSTWRLLNFILWVKRSEIYKD